MWNIYDAINRYFCSVLLILKVLKMNWKQKKPSVEKTAFVCLFVFNYNIFHPSVTWKRFDLELRVCPL